LVAVVGLVATALVLRSRGSSDGGDGLALRRAAALQPCPPALGRDLPALTLPCLGGGEDVALASAPPGRPTLVNIWATWCPPCVREVPLLRRFHEQAGDRVGLVGVLHEDERDLALEFARQYGMHWPSVVDDDGKVLRKFSAGPPVTLFVDAAGSVTYVQRGEIKSATQLHTLVQKHLGVTV
jgi:thiol-disulfide isomerase/thioredoxin